MCDPVAMMPDYKCSQVKEKTAPLRTNEWNHHPVAPQCVLSLAATTATGASLVAHHNCCGFFTSEDNRWRLYAALFFTTNESKPEIEARRSKLPWLVVGGATHHPKTFQPCIFYWVSQRLPLTQPEIHSYDCKHWCPVDSR